MPSAVHHRVVTDPASGLPVLVKTASEAAGRARLAGEAERLARLAHLAVVRPVAHRDDGTRAELHLAWVGPHSLATVVGLSPEASAAVGAGVADALAGLHAQGLVHGALRPDHVLLAADGAPVLTGLAHAVPIGAAGADGAVATPADDVAALGLLLVGLVQPTDPGALVPERRRHRRRDAGTRGVLLTLADRATADDPGARPTAAALATDLRALAPSTPPAPTAPPRAPHPPATDRSLRRRAVATAALVALVGGLALAATWLVPDPAPDDDLPVAARPSGRPGTRPPAPPTTPPAPTTATPSTATPSTAETGPDCPPATPPAADVDGDGCPDPLRIDGEEVSAGPTTWIVGRVGDRPAVADWDCDGRATVALLRPGTGEVFVFPSWARPGAAVTVSATTVVAGAERIEASDPDGDGCAALVAHRPGRPPLTVPVRPAS